MLNQFHLTTAEEVAREIEDHWDATEEFSRGDKNQAGFIAPVGKGPAKGGRNLIQWDVLWDTAIGAVESVTRSRSVGLNEGYTRKNAPQDSDFKEAFERGRAQRTMLGKITTSPIRKAKGEGKGHKVKVKVKVKLKVKVKVKVKVQVKVKVKVHRKGTRKGKGKGIRKGKGKGKGQGKGRGKGKGHKVKPKGKGKGKSNGKRQWQEKKHSGKGNRNQDQAGSPG